MTLLLISNIVIPFQDQNYIINKTRDYICKNHILFTVVVAANQAVAVP